MGRRRPRHHRRPMVKTQGVDPDTWCKAGDVQRMRARLLVKVLRERATRRCHDWWNPDVPARRTIAWCREVAEKIEAKYR